MSPTNLRSTNWWVPNYSNQVIDSNIFSHFQVAMIPTIVRMIGVKLSEAMPNVSMILWFALELMLVTLHNATQVMEVAARTLILVMTATCVPSIAVRLMMEKLNVFLTSYNATQPMYAVQPVVMQLLELVQRR